MTVLKKNNKKIVIISNSDFTLVNFRFYLIKDILSLSHTVYALAPNFNAETRARLEQMGVVCITYSLDRVGFNPFGDLYSILSLSAILKKIDPDIVLAYTVKPVVFGTIASWIVGVPRRIALIEGLGYVFTNYSKRVPLKRTLLRLIVGFLYKFSLSLSHIVIMLNPDDRDDFVKFGILNPQKVKLIDGIGINLEDYPYSKPFNQVCTFILVARMLKEKGVYEFVEAARYFNRNSINARFVLVGGHDSNPGSISLHELNTWSSSGIVEWTGHVDNVLLYLNRASVFVLPSYREGLPRSTLEAMAIGRPVITTNVPGCRQTVVDGQNGFLIPPQDSMSLIKAMEIFINDTNKVVNMGLASRQIAENRFDIKKINKDFLNYIFG